MNEIDNVRTETARYFNPDSEVLDTKESEVSPCGRYQLTCSLFHQNDPARNWDILKVTVMEIESNRTLLEYFTEYPEEFHGWIHKAGTQYLLFPEALGGQTVIDPARKKFSSHYDSGDEFIWTAFHPSPAGRWLVVSGAAHMQLPSTILQIR